MDVINKFYSSVSSTVSQLSGVLPGNPVTREFEASEHISSAGQGLLWKVYKGFKKSTKQEAAIFVFEKKQLERWPKDDRDAMLETLKRGITQLTKIRHPQILTVQHPLEESRESLAFATEPVFASLANVLGNTTNMPTPLPQGIANYKLFEVEIKYGLIQLAEGIGFLHHDVKLLHRNINPEAIVINNQGVWKIFGFEFCVLNQKPHEPQPYWPYTEYNATWHLLTQPYLEYMAPECALISSHSPASDIYALGVLIYALHSVGGKPPKMFGKDFGAYKRFAGELKQGKFPNFSAIPDGLQDFIKLMFNAVPEMRPDIHDFPKIPFFDDVGVKTLSYLDALFQWDNLQKSKFYKGLPQVISKMPHRINMFRILPCLVKEFVNPPMIPFVLPNVLLIAENSTDRDFVKHILPHLKPVMKIHDPIQILLIFMQKMELLLKLTPAEDVKSDVLPMLYRALESDAQQIQELCLSILPTFASLIDYPAMKNALLPRIKKLCVNTGLVSVRVNCLLCIGKLLEHLDKWLVMDEVFPFLPKIPSREPAVLMGILGIYKLALTHNKLGITKDVMATKVIPFLMPLCIENGLSLSQFNAILSVIKDMIGRVESEHRTKLEQLNSIQKESKALDFNMQSTTGPLVPSAPVALTSETDQMFANLGLEGYLSSQTREPKPVSVQLDAVEVPGKTSLSLQDKQRLVKQQEQAKILNSQGPLNPAPAMSKMTLNQPKDLTSSLIASNMSQLKTSASMPATATNWNSFGQTKQSTQLASNTWVQSPPASSLTSVTSNWSQQPAIMGAPTSQWNASNNGGWGNAFDNLLPNKSAAKVPMNQLTTSMSLNQPLMPAMSGNNNNNSSSSTLLSADDIMNFLN